MARKTKPAVVLGVRVAPAIKRELQDLAKEDNRSLSNYVEQVLANFLVSRKEPVAA